MADVVTTYEITVAEWKGFIYYPLGSFYRAKRKAERMVLKGQPGSVVVRAAGCHMADCSSNSGPSTLKNTWQDLYRRMEWKGLWQGHSPWKLFSHFISLVGLPYIK